MNLIKLAADDYIANINVSYSHFARYPKLATGKSCTSRPKKILAAFWLPPLQLVQAPTSRLWGVAGLRCFHLNTANLEEERSQGWAS
jgi:hypothetical protein